MVLVIIIKPTCMLDILALFALIAQLKYYLSSHGFVDLCYQHNRQWGDSKTLIEAYNVNSSVLNTIRHDTIR